MYNSSREKVLNLFFLELMQKTDILQQVKDVKETFIAAHSHALVNQIIFYGSQP